MNSLIESCLNKFYCENRFLSRDGTQSAVYIAMACQVVCLSSVCNIEVLWLCNLAYVENNYSPQQYQSSSRERHPISCVVGVRYEIGGCSEHKSCI